jgi:hypothetical protein
MFDFRENVQNAPYQIVQFAQALERLRIIKPVQKFSELAALNWPPAPNYYRTYSYSRTRIRASERCYFPC